MMKPILFDFPMPIKTKNLILALPKIGDGKTIRPAILETFDDLKLTMPWAKTIPSIEDCEEFVRQAAANWIFKNNEEPYLPLFIFCRHSMDFIGSAGYHHMNWDIPSLEAGYWLRQSSMGKGIMTEAINALTQYAFKQLHVKRLAITCDIKNLRSKKIPERLGYCLEGVLKNHRIDPESGAISDTLLYARYDLEGLPPLSVTWD